MKNNPEYYIGKQVRVFTESHRMFKRILKTDENGLFYVFENNMKCVVTPRYDTDKTWIMWFEVDYWTGK